MAKTSKKSGKSVQEVIKKEGEEREKALKKALGEIEKECGKGSIMRMGDRPEDRISVIPTGAMTLDIALGIGGVPRGRIVEIYGPESSGKTTVALHVVAEAQKRGGYAAFIDAEHALDPEYAERLGVDIDNLLVSQPDNGEQALQIAEALIRSGALDVIVVDSVAALVPKSEIDGDMGDAPMAQQARLMSQALRKLAGVINRSNTVLIFINQMRQKIGIFFGNPETTTGGIALKFYASIRMDVRRGEVIKNDEGMPIGNKTTVKIVKNKLAPPFREAEFDLIYGEGVSKLSCIIDVATDEDIIQKSGSWYSYKDERLGQGKEKAKQFLKDNPETAEEIEAEIRRRLISDGNEESPEFSGPVEETADDDKPENSAEAKQNKGTEADSDELLDDILDLDNV